MVQEYEWGKGFELISHVMLKVDLNLHENVNQACNVQRLEEDNEKDRKELNYSTI